MADHGSIFLQAMQMIFSGDAELFEIIGLSLRVTLSAVVISCIIGLPLGAILAVTKFPGRRVLILTFNTLMGLPPVVAGLFVFFFVASGGPLGWLEILYTPAAMILAQTVLVTPIVIALSRQTVADLNEEYAELFLSLSLNRWQRVRALLWDARFSLLGEVAHHPSSEGTTERICVNPAIAIDDSNKSNVEVVEESDDRA